MVIVLKLAYQSLVFVIDSYYSSKYDIHTWC